MTKITLIIALLLVSASGSMAQEWQTIGFPSNEAITSIIMFDADTGCVATADGNFGWTFDRGKSWSRSPDVSIVRLESICFLDKKTGWICGHRGRILFTDDGGDSWSDQTWPDTLAIFFDIQMINKDTGIAVGMLINDLKSLNSIAIRTTDGGKNWKELDPMGLSYSEATYDSANKMLYFMSMGRLNYSGDGGRKWKSVITLEGPPARTFSILGTAGLMAGPKGVCGYTVDGGKVWYKNQRTETEHFFSSVIVDHKRGFIGGLNGLLLYTADGGRNWQPEYPPKEFTILNMFARDETVYVVGTDGTIMSKNLKAEK